MLKHQFTSLSDFVKLRNTIKKYLESISHGESDLLFVATNEAVNNAFFHGYKSNCPANVELTITKLQEEILITVKHDGEGYKFDEALEKHHDDLNEHGRGLSIIGLCTDSYRFNSSGNELEIRKYLKHSSR